MSISYLSYLCVVAILPQEDFVDSMAVLAQDQAMGLLVMAILTRQATAT